MKTELPEIAFTFSEDDASLSPEAVEAAADFDYADSKRPTHSDNLGTALLLYTTLDEGVYYMLTPEADYDKKYHIQNDN